MRISERDVKEHCARKKKKSLKNDSYKLSKLDKAYKFTDSSSVRFILGWPESSIVFIADVFLRVEIT